MSSILIGGKYTFAIQHFWHIRLCINYYSKQKFSFSGKRKTKTWWPRRDSNTQPSDLESDALPLRHGVKLCEVLPRFELGSLDSKSRVLTITPWDPSYCIVSKKECILKLMLEQIRILFLDKIELPKMISPDLKARQTQHSVFYYSTNYRLSSSQMFWNTSAYF